MTWVTLNSIDELSALISGQTNSGAQAFLILKHSPRCMISSMAKSRIERAPDSRLVYYLIDVISQRELSNALAAQTDIPHESPQSFLFNQNTLVDVKSHMGIAPQEFSKRLDSIPES